MTKPTRDLRTLAEKGTVHRAQEHHGRPAVQQAANQASDNRGGRPRAFPERTVKVAVFLPPATAKKLRQAALDREQTLSQIVAHLADTL